MRGSGRMGCSRGAVRVGRAAVLGAPLAGLASPAAARPFGHESLLSGLDMLFSREELAALSLLFGIIAFAVMVAIMLVRTRRRLRDTECAAREESDRLAARLERAEGLLAADQAVLVVWDETAADPEIRCASPGTAGGLPARRGDVLAFGKWLVPESAGELDALVDRLRARGEAFNVMLRTRAGGHVEADGRTAGGRAVLRLRDLVGQRRELAEIYDRHKQLMRDVESLRGLLDAVPMPVWVRDGQDRLVWSNRAFASALAGEDEVRDESAHLLDEGDRQSILRAHAEEKTVHRRLAATLSGERRILDVFDSAFSHGTAGIAVDVTDLERAGGELARREEAHARTLDRIATGVAVFGADGRLTSHNAAFRALWPLDGGYLASSPSFGEILDRLRAQRRLPEQADYRAWRASHVDAFERSLAGRDGQGPLSREELWHLPDAQILRVVLAPNADGELAWLVDDVTESLDLESRFVALTRVQRETLDSLEEGIAVFGSDGRLKLYNPALADIWDLPRAELDGEPHVEALAGWCRKLYDDGALWRWLHTSVTGLADTREPAAARIERADGQVLDLRLVPLPDGATLAVFIDVSDSAHIERALRDRNEALVAAERIKNEFVHKVSYELRSPLTNIIGFAQLIGDETTGPLNERQREYSGHILASSGALLAIINDILDLATIDAGVMELEISDVDIAGAVGAAIEGLRDRVAESGLTLEVDAPDGIGTFEADEKRVRQILFNLLANAVSFSERGGSVRVSAGRDGDRVTLAVADDGPGMPDELRHSVFDRFESHALGTGHRGAGLGLSIVKSFVELHGGEVRLDTAPGRGTTLTCLLPARQRPAVREDDAAAPSDGTQAGSRDAHRTAAPGRVR